MKNLLILLLTLSLFGCQNSKPDFESLINYGDFKVSDTYKQEESTKSILVNIRIQELNLKDLLLSLSDEYSVPIVWNSSLNDLKVSGYFNDIELETVLDTIARRVESSYININGVHYIGKLESSDLASAVFPMPAGDETNIKTMLSNIVSGNGKITTLGGQVIIRDNADNIRRYSDIFTNLSRTTRKYLIELWFTNVRTDFLLNLGAELQIKGIDIFTSFNASSLFTLTTSKLNLDTEYSNILQRPVLQVLEGTASTIKVGREVPLEESSISSEGYSTVTGYDIISDGLNLTATVRRLVDEKLMLDIELEISTFEDISSTYPIKDTQSIDTTVIFKDSEVFLLGGYGRNSFASSFILFESLLTYEDSIILVWCKIRELQ